MYRYVGNNPLTHTDPLGLCEDDGTSKDPASETGNDVLFAAPIRKTRLRIRTKTHTAKMYEIARLSRAAYGKTRKDVEKNTPAGWEVVELRRHGKVRAVLFPTKRPANMSLPSQEPNLLT